MQIRREESGQTWKSFEINFPFANLRDLFPFEVSYESTNTKKLPH